MINRVLGIGLMIGLSLTMHAQQLKGSVVDEEGQPLAGVTIFLKGTNVFTESNTSGAFSITVPKSTFVLVTFKEGFTSLERSLSGMQIPDDLTLEMTPLNQELAAVEVVDEESPVLRESWLLSVSGSAIYEAKKSELIQVDDLIANKGANVSRQIYSKVPGLNIWESDGAGIQLGIGGRGLNPNRTSNFNVRQNGYDIAADALGYPESYYTPPVQALERIEIVRGAAGLQYGTQFGGMVNFVFKEAPKDSPFTFNSEQSAGSFGLFNSFNSIGGTSGKLSYYGYYQYKRSNGWRPNANLSLHNVFGTIKYQFSPFASLKVEHTHSQYLAQQPGGLTDSEFAQDARQSKRTRNWFDVNWDLTALVLDVRFNPSFKINNRLFILNASRFAVGNLGRIDRPDDLNAPRDLLKDNFNNWGNELRALWNYRLFGRPAVFLVGNRYYQGKTQQKQGLADSGTEASFNFMNNEIPQKSAFDLPSRNISFFAENIFNITPKLSVTPGVRHEYILTEADGYYFDRRFDLAGNVVFEAQVPELRENGRSFTFAGLGLSYKQSQALEVYSNLSQNFRAINFNDIRVDIPSLVVDPDISDERGFNADFGIRGNEDKLFRYDVSAFFLAYNDRIGNVLKSGPDERFDFLSEGVDPPTRIFRERTNVGDAVIYGVEIYGETDLFKWILQPKNMEFHYFLNLALLNSKYTSSQENGIENNEVELVPRTNFKTGFTYRFKDFGASMLYSYLSDQFSEATNAVRASSLAIDGLIPAYDILDVSLSYKWDLFRFEGGVNNILDARYFTRRATGYPGPGIIPSEGRSFYLTVAFRLD